MTVWQFFQSLCIALALGSAIGLERQITGHSIGIRTGMLVCAGACLFTSFAACVPNGDITRMASQVVTGVGFLGSGIIFKDGLNVRGLNTAATIWCTAAVGVLVGGMLYDFAAMAACGLIVINLALRFLPHWAVQVIDDTGGIFRLALVCAEEKESSVRETLVALLSRKKNDLIALDRRLLPAHQVQLEAKFVFDGKDYVKNCEKLVRELLALETVCDVRWKIDG